jgi:hypothetical protein
MMDILSGVKPLIVDVRQTRSSPDVHAVCWRRGMEVVSLRREPIEIDHRPDEADDD